MTDGTTVNGTAPVGAGVGSGAAVPVGSPGEVTVGPGASGAPSEHAVRPAHAASTSTADAVLLARIVPSACLAVDAAIVAGFEPGRRERVSEVARA